MSFYTLNNPNQAAPVGFGLGSNLVGGSGLSMGSQSATGGSPDTGGWMSPMSFSPSYSGVASARAQHMDNSIANRGFGLNMNTFNNVVGGISALSNLWGGWQAQKMAKEQFKLNKAVTNTNLMNQIQSYNTSLRDRIDTRAHMQGDSQEYADKYYNDNQLKRHK